MVRAYPAGNDRVADSQMTASSVWSSSYQPHHGRLDLQTVRWSAWVRGIPQRKFKAATKQINSPSQPSSATKLILNTTNRCSDETPE